MNAEQPTLLPPPPAKRPQGPYACHGSLTCMGGITCPEHGRSYFVPVTVLYRGTIPIFATDAEQARLAASDHLDWICDNGQPEVTTGEPRRAL